MEIDLDGIEIESDRVAVISCPICSSENLIKNGTRRRKSQKIRQFQCKDCGKFFLEVYLYPGANPELTDYKVVEVYLACKSYNAASRRLEIARSTVKKRVKGFGMDPYQTGEKGCEVEYEWGSGIKTKYKNPWELEGGDAYYLGR